MKPKFFCAEDYDSNWIWDNPSTIMSVFLKRQTCRSRKAATEELLARVNDPDSAVRFWAVGLVALRSNEAGSHKIQAAAKDVF